MKEFEVVSRKSLFSQVHVPDNPSIFYWIIYSVLEGIKSFWIKCPICINNCPIGSDDCWISKPISRAKGIWPIWSKSLVKYNQSISAYLKTESVNKKESGYGEGRNWVLSNVYICWCLLGRNVLGLFFNDSDSNSLHFQLNFLSPPGSEDLIISLQANQPNSQFNGSPIKHVACIKSYIVN